VMCALLCVFLFFFFQAEDGIRDFHVTGVQTCALPISSEPVVSESQYGGWSGAVTDIPGSTSASAVAISTLTTTAKDVLEGAFMRSEERRVGKEWRCGGSPEQ